MIVAAKIVVQGLVQGVGFRYFVYRHATRLGLAGNVHNLPSGDVAMEVHGERGLIEELIKELKVGPRAAHVRDLKIEWKSVDSTYLGFDIL